MNVLNKFGRIFAVAMCLCCWQCVCADDSGLSYFAQINSLNSNGDNAPFWLVAKQQGVSSLKNNNGFLRSGVAWEQHFGANKESSYRLLCDFIAGYGHTDNLMIQQLFAELSWRKILITLGAKEHLSEMSSDAVPRGGSAFANSDVHKFFSNLYYDKFTDIGSGGLLYSGNSMPVPQLRLEAPTYVNFPWTNEWIKIRGHISYGILPDYDFQKDFSKGNDITRYAKNVLFHSKALFVKIGKPEKFPLTFEGGLEMYSQFGGDIYTHADGKVVSMPSGAKDFFKALIPLNGGDDTPLDEQTNISGNQIGNWHAAFTLHTKPADIKIYGEHLFEDFSQLFFVEYQSDKNGDKNIIYYPWKDLLVGISVHNKSTIMPFISNICYEYLSTYDQSGALYHDPTVTLKEQMDGVDDYYNHGIYPGWHYRGMGMGTPLVFSPLYNKNGSLRFTGNRLVAHHIGLNGDFGDKIPMAFKCLYTYSENWGTYLNPYIEKGYTNSMSFELAYAPSGGWLATMSFGYDNSNIIGNNWGVMFTLLKVGLLK